MTRLIAFSVPGTSYEVWIAPEHVQTVSWGGDDMTSIRIVSGETIVVAGALHDVARTLNAA